MGFFDSLKADIEAAQATSGAGVTVTPAQRIDTHVTEPASGQQRRRTDYAGTVWYGGPPQEVSGRTLPGRTEQVDTPFVVPDSHTYDDPQGVLIQASASLQTSRATSGGGEADILSTEAAILEGRLHLRLTVRGMLPIGVAYRVIVLAAAG